MFNWKAGLAKIDGFRVKPLLVFVIGLFVFIVSVPDVALAMELSESHVINIDPASKKKIGAKVWGEVKQFFTDAETAIETENLEMLIGLYSANYNNGVHTKESVKRVWKRIFKQLSNMATIHNMRFITTTPNSNVMIIRCSGLLLGVPQGEKNLITVDNWTDIDHVLSKEDGKWKLIGTSGHEQKRFWFDKPMHPLF
jgi:hypothetical protein